ncbi:hypothetical protein [Aerobium aerolatum]|uniref:Uncharacterized protein n=1 Tax=Aquamicrobium aerolatum DSM 21857 TaxID=1121003 RepID=A0A1I3R4D3_9HYPH|nr:hypothetical protein [Aquamicrobium aerolatum]SFJ40106.1 hypothetical protein SAMN03080618_02871 [Aquamicrobium aerolatum DSM 21857]
MQIALLAALAIGFVVSLRFGPITIVPLAALAVVIGLLSDVTFDGSRLLAAIVVVTALNAGYLLGAFSCWWLKTRARR